MVELLKIILNKKVTLDFSYILTQNYEINPQISFISLFSDEKIVVQLSKANPDCFAEFSELGPTYLSVDAIIGEMDCKFFFPPGYNQSEAEAKQEKKKQKKRSKRHAAAVNKEASVAASEVAVDNQNETDQIEDENEEQDSEEEKLAGSEDAEHDNSVVGADKATSPIHENTTE